MASGVKAKSAGGFDPMTRSLNAVRNYFAFAGAYAPQSPYADRLRAAQLAAIMRHSVTLLLANVANGAILVVAEAPGPNLVGLLIWFGVLLAYMAPLVFQLIARRHRAPPAEIRATVARRAILNAGILGLIWGAAPVLFFKNQMDAQFIFSSICLGMMCGGAFGMATLPAAVVAYLTPMCAGCLEAMLTTSSAHLNVLTPPLLLCYTLALIYGAASHGRSFAEKVVAQMRAEAAARHDPVTGLANRATFENAIHEALKRFKRYGERFTLLHIDLVDFKTVNDRFGYQDGDRLLRLAARSRRRALRS